jgi:hypothetical protein
MDSMAVRGLGAGVLQGLETVRQRRRQDESDEMRRDNHGMRQQQFGLQMEGQRMGNEQTALNLDYTKKTQPLKMRQLERQDAAGEQKAEAQRIADLARKAAQAFERGDINAANEYTSEINPDNPSYLLPPTDSGDPNMFTAVIGGQKQDMSGRDYYQSLLAHTNPDKVIEVRANLGGDKAEANWRRLNDGGLYNQRTGEVRGAGAAGGASGSDYGGMKPVDWNRLDSRNTAFFGKLDETGQIILDGDAKFQKDEANTRTMQMVGSGVPAWQAEIIARASVGGTSSGANVRQAAEEAAIAEGLRPGEEYDSFIANYLQESDATGQQEAEALYQQLTGGGQQGLGMSQQQPQGGPGLAPQQGMQSPGSMPQGGDQQQFVRTGTTPDGRRVGQLPDGRVVDLATGQEVR